MMSITTFRIITATALLSTLGSAALAGGIVPTSQLREVYGDAEASDGIQTVTDDEHHEATLYEPFSASASAYAEVIDAFGSGGGWQNSTITGTSISASGSHFGNSESYAFNTESYGSGRSIFEITFEITSAVDFSIDVTIEAYDNGFTSFSFTGPSGPVITVDPPFNQMNQASTSGILAPGVYTMIARSRGGTSAFGSNGFDYAFGEYNVEFEIFPPLIGDINGDGVVDVADLLLLLGAWGACPGCSEDLNGDDVVDVQDLLLLLANWS